MRTKSERKEAEQVVRDSQAELSKLETERLRLGHAIDSAQRDLREIKATVSDLTQERKLVAMWIKPDKGSLAEIVKELPVERQTDLQKIVRDDVFVRTDLAPSFDPNADIATVFGVTLDTSLIESPQLDDEATLLTKLDLYDEQLSELERRAEQCESDITYGREELKKLNVSETGLRQTSAVAEKRLDTANKKNADLDYLIVQAKQEFEANTSAKIEELRQQLNVLEQQHSDELAAIEDVLRQAKVSFQEERALLEERHHALVETLSADLNNLKQAHEKDKIRFNEELSNLLEESGVSGKKIQELEEAAQCAEEKLNTAWSHQRELKAYDGFIEQKQEHFKNLTENLAKTDEELVAFDRQTKTKIASLKEERSVISDRLSALQKQWRGVSEASGNFAAVLSQHTMGSAAAVDHHPDFYPVSSAHEINEQLNELERQRVGLVKTGNGSTAKSKKPSKLIKVHS